MLNPHDPPGKTITAYGLNHHTADAAQREVLLFEFFLGVFEVHQRNRLMQAGRKMALASSSRPRARVKVVMAVLLRWWKVAQL